MKLPEDNHRSNNQHLELKIVITMSKMIIHIGEMNQVDCSVNNFTYKTDTNECATQPILLVKRENKVKHFLTH